MPKKSQVHEHKDLSFFVSIYVSVGVRALRLGVA